MFVQRKPFGICMPFVDIMIDLIGRGGARQSARDKI